MLFITLFGYMISTLTSPSFALEGHSQAIYFKDSVRPNPNLKTCWINPEADRIIANESSLKIVEQLVTQEYQRAGIYLSGWNLCDGSEDPKDVIKILIADAQPRVSDIGCVQSSSWCIRLNFTFLTWPGIDSVCKSYSWENAWACNCHLDEYAKACVQNYGLHEFGHALGLAHEADHSKSTCDDKTGTYGALEPFDYDPLSIMNYCANKDQILNKLTPGLSDVDIQTIELLYPATFLSLIP